MASDAASALLEFPPDKTLSAKQYDAQAHAFVQKLDKADKADKATFTRASGGKGNILDLLDPAVNTLPYLYALVAQSDSAGKDRSRHEEVLQRATIFFATFDAVQVRYASHIWERLLNYVLDMYPKLGLVDFTPIVTAMLRLDPACSTFTCAHLHLLHLCLQAGTPSQALPVLDKNITAFPQTPIKNVPDENLSDPNLQSNTFITAKSGFVLASIKPEHVIEYYLLGAFIYIGHRNFARARQFLEYILLTPTTNGSCSVLQVEAYKKWLLLGLLAQGKAYPLPRTHNAAVFKSLKAVSKAYETLVENFEKRAWAKFHAEVELGGQTWTDDGNARLVKEVGDALYRYRVLDLQKTYAALPVSRVATLLQASPSDTSALLNSMLQLGYINASISEPSSADPVLHFHDTDAPAPAPTSSDDSLEAQTQRIQTLIAAIRDADRRLQLTKEYVEAQKRAKRGGAGPDGDLADQMDLTFDAPIAGLDDEEEEDGFAGEEDIMER